MRYFLCIVFLLSILSFPRMTNATCGHSWDFLSEGYEGTYICQFPQGLSPFIKRVSWQINWSDITTTVVDVSDSGVSRYYTSFGLLHCEACWPAFNTPYFESVYTTSTWVQVTKSGKIFNGQCATNSAGWSHEYERVTAIVLAQQVPVNSRTFTISVNLAVSMSLALVQERLFSSTC